MKKRFLLVTIVTLAIAQASIATSLVIKKVNTPIVLDGVKNEAAWTGATKIKVDKPFFGETVVGGSLDVSILYDADNLYFFFEVKDDIVTLDNTDSWKGDKVELYFGLPGYTRGLGAGDDGCRQFIYNGDLTWASDPATMNHQTWYTESTWPGLASRATDGSDFKYVETSAGYNYEAKINKSALENIDFATIDTLAFDIYLVDNDIIGNGLGVRNRLVYHNNGDLEFKNENWNVLDLVAMSFEKTTGVKTLSSNTSNAYISGSTLKIKSGKKVDVEISDLSGRTILTASNSNSLSLSSLNKGVYFAKIKEGNITSVLKFIK